MCRCLQLSAIISHYVRYLPLSGTACYHLPLSQTYWGCPHTKWSMPTHPKPIKATHSSDQVLAETAFLQTAYSRPTRKPTRNNPTRSPFSKLWDKWVSTCSRTWGIYFRIIPRDSKPCRRGIQDHQQLPTLDTHSQVHRGLVRYLPK